MSDSLGTYLWGLAALGLFLILVVLAAKFSRTRGWLDVRRLWVGKDGRASTSKFQWFLWTGVVIFAYVTVAVSRFPKEGIGAPEIPLNLLLAMGASSATMVFAKSITTGQVESGQVAKAAPETPAPAKGGLLQTDDGYPDLSKTQLLAWTFIAIAFFLASLRREMHAPGTDGATLPDIDATLVILMGIGQGAYLGKKLVLDTDPVISTLDKHSGVPGTSVTIGGQNLGSAGFILVDGARLVTAPSAWTDKGVTFALPTTLAAGIVQIALETKGAKTNELPFTVVAPPSASAGP